MDVSQWILQLSSEDSAEVAAAAEALAHAGPENRAAAVPLVRVAGSGAESAAEWASAALEDMGPPSPSDLSALAAFVDQHLAGKMNARQAYLAITLIGRLEEQGAGAITTLSAALEHSPGLSVRERAAWALGQLGPSAEPARIVLEHAASDGPPRLSRLARRALSRLP